MIDDRSEPGAWAEALRYPNSITVIPGPRLSKADHPGGFEAHPASSVAAASGYPVRSIGAAKDGNGAFHHSSEVPNA